MADEETSEEPEVVESEADDVDVTDEQESYVPEPAEHLTESPIAAVEEEAEENLMLEWQTDQLLSALDYCCLSTFSRQFLSIITGRAR